MCFITHLAGDVDLDEEDEVTPEDDPPAAAAVEFVGGTIPLLRWRLAGRQEELMTVLLPCGLWLWCRPWR